MGRDMSAVQRHTPSTQEKKKKEEAVQAACFGDRHRDCRHGCAFLNRPVRRLRALALVDLLTIYFS